MTEIIEYPTPAQLREAYRVMRAALRDGRLVRPAVCTWCGGPPGKKALHGHHADYARPLMVVWLCASCHRKHHARYWVEREMHRTLGDDS